VNSFLGTRGRLHFAAASLLAQLAGKGLAVANFSRAGIGPRAFVRALSLQADHATRKNYFPALISSYSSYRINMQSP
jgi:hypothetical protein